MRGKSSGIQTSHGGIPKLREEGFSSRSLAVCQPSPSQPICKIRIVSCSRLLWSTTLSTLLTEYTHTMDRVYTSVRTIPETPSLHLSLETPSDLISSSPARFCSDDSKKRGKTRNQISFIPEDMTAFSSNGMSDIIGNEEVTAEDTFITLRKKIEYLSTFKH
jgi:hypothetical protein